MKNFKIMQGPMETGSSQGWRILPHGIVSLIARQVWVILAVVSAMGGINGCSRKESAASPLTRPAVVRVEKVVYSAEAIPVYATGVLSRKTEANLSFKVGGIVDEIPVRVGDRVKSGDVLARLRLVEIDARVAQARSGLEKAQRDFARVEKLRADNVATLENLQDAKTAVDEAEAGLRITEFNRDHAVIVAAANGRILRRLAEPGEMIEAGRTVLVFASDEDGWIVRAGVAERDVVRLRVGDLAEVKQGGVNAPAIRARIAQISEATEPTTRTTEVELSLDAAPEGGRSGFVVRLMIVPQPVEERPVVAASALIEGVGRKSSLFLVEANASVAKRVQVDVSGIDGERVFLKTLLPRDASIVISGAEYLQDGVPVEASKN
jgi:RND family efflux transporter MFP subunit